MDDDQGGTRRGLAGPLRDLVLGALVPGALGLVMLWQVTATYPEFNATYDEPYHIAAGVEAYQHGRFTAGAEQPPLARWVIGWLPHQQGVEHRTVTHRAASPRKQLLYLSRSLLEEQGDYWTTLTLARTGVLVFIPVLIFVRVPLERGIVRSARRVGSLWTGCFLAEPARPRRAGDSRLCDCRRVDGGSVRGMALVPSPKCSPGRGRRRPRRVCCRFQVLGVRLSAGLAGGLLSVVMVERSGHGESQRACSRSIHRGTVPTFPMPTFLRVWIHGSVGLFWV